MASCKPYSKVLKFCENKQFLDRFSNGCNIKFLCLLEHLSFVSRNERYGIPVEILQVLDVCVEIPQSGMIRSLNVHVTGALLIWEYYKQWNLAGGPSIPSTGWHAILLADLPTHESIPHYLWNYFMLKLESSFSDNDTVEAHFQQQHVLFPIFGVSLLAIDQWNWISEANVSYPTVGISATIRSTGFVKTLAFCKSGSTKNFYIGNYEQLFMKKETFTL